MPKFELSRNTRRITALLLLIIFSSVMLASVDANSKQRYQRRATTKNSQKRSNQTAQKNRIKRNERKERKERAERAERADWRVGKRLNLKEALVPPQSELHEQFEENPELRRRALLFPRTYPFDTIPANARQAAWDARPLNKLKPKAAQQWQSVGPKPTFSAYPANWGQTSGRINSIAVSPADPKLVLVGASTGGVWRSTDGGDNFVPVTDNQVDLAVGSIAFAESNPNIVYAGLGDPALNYLGTGVLKSIDAGKTWQRVNNSTLPGVGITAEIDVDPTNPDRVYLAQALTQSSSGGLALSGVYISTDGGVNWKRTLTGFPKDLVRDPNSPQTLYATMSIAFENNQRVPEGLFISTDGGNKWTRLFTSPYERGTSDIRVSVSKADSRIIYLYMGGFLNSGFDVRVLRSKNGGKKFKNLGSTGIDRGQFGYNTYIYVDPTNVNTVYVGSRDIFKSVDGGKRWTNLNTNFEPSGSFNPFESNTHPDQHALTFAPSDANTIYIGNDGGLSVSTDGGKNFDTLNSTLTLTQSYNLSAHPTDSSIIYTGTQDNGLQKRGGSSSIWEELVSGDYNAIIFRKSDPRTITIHFVFGQIFQLTDDIFFDFLTDNGTFGESNFGPRIAFLAPLSGNNADDRLYFGTWRLFLSEDVGKTWAPTAGMTDLTRGNTDVLKVITVSSSDAQVIYTGSEQGRVMVSSNGGKNFKDITRGLPNRSIASITIDKNDASTAYLTVSGFRSGHVFKTTDRGTTWQDISANLPDIPVNAFLVDPSSSTTFYVGTDIGVFRSIDSGQSWETFNDGLPPVIVMSFAVTADGVINLATYGRGVYQLK